jgi:hypothetical protein
MIALLRRFWHWPKRTYLRLLNWWRPKFDWDEPDFP